MNLDERSSKLLVYISWALVQPAKFRFYTKQAKSYRKAAASTSEPANKSARQPRHKFWSYRTKFCFLRRDKISFLWLKTSISLVRLKSQNLGDNREQQKPVGSFHFEWKSSIPRMWVSWESERRKEKCGFFPQSSQSTHRAWVQSRNHKTTKILESPKGKNLRISEAEKSRNLR